MSWETLSSNVDQNRGISGRGSGGARRSDIGDVVEELTSPVFDAGFEVCRDGQMGTWDQYGREREEVKVVSIE